MNAYLIMIPNNIVEVQYFVVVEKFVKFRTWRLLNHACPVERVNTRPFKYFHVSILSFEDYYANYSTVTRNVGTYLNLNAWRFQINYWNSTIWMLTSVKCSMCREQWAFIYTYNVVYLKECYVIFFSSTHLNRLLSSINIV